MPTDRSVQPVSLEGLRMVTTCLIPLAAAFAAQTHGDARKAIDLVRVAGELAEREGDGRVREEHVREDQDKVEKNRVVCGISTQKSSVFSRPLPSLLEPTMARYEVRLVTVSTNFSPTQLMPSSITRRHTSIK